MIIWVTAAAAIAPAGIQEAIGAECDLPTIVIFEWLRDRQDDVIHRRVESHSVVIAVEAVDHGFKAAIIARVGKENFEIAIAEIRMKRHPE